MSDVLTQHPGKVDNEVKYEMDIDQAAAAVRDAGAAPVALRFAPGNMSGHDVAFATLDEDSYGQHGPFLLVAVLGRGSFAFKIREHDAPHPTYVQEKIGLAWPDSCALHLLIAEIFGAPPMCSRADAHIEYAA